MFQRAANRLGLIVMQAGETGADQLAVAGDDRFGKRIGLGEQAMGLAADDLDALLGFVLLSTSAPTYGRSIRCGP